MPNFNENISVFNDFDNAPDVIEELDMEPESDVIESLNMTSIISSRTSIPISRLYLGKTAYVDYTGVIKAGSQKIQDVADPTLDQDVATKKYVDSNIDILEMRQEVHIEVMPTGMVVKDGLPIAIPDEIKNNPTFFGRDGWITRNKTAGSKSHFYVPIHPLKYSDIKGINMDVMHFVANTSPSFVTFYSAPLGDGNDSASWYRSKMTFVVPNASTLIPLQDYTFFINTPPIPTYGIAPYAKIPIELALSTSASVGTPIAPNDVVYLIAVSTDSGAAVGRVDYLLQNFKLITERATYRFNFSSAPLEVLALKAQNSTLNTELLASIARTVELEQQMEQLYQNIYRVPRTSTIES